MTTQTTNYSFTKDDINEPYDVLRVNANLDAIDTEIKKKETQIGDKANLVTVTKTNLVAAINEVKEQTNNLVAYKADLVDGKVPSDQLPNIEVPVQSVNSKTGVVILTKSDIELGSVDNTADTNKNVLSATKLTTARTINGVAFDGTANIAIADGTKAPTSHANSGNTYGLGSPTLHGHCKTINSLTQASHVDGTALSAYQGKLLSDLITKKELKLYGTYSGTANVPFNITIPTDWSELRVYIVNLDLSNNGQFGVGFNGNNVIETYAYKNQSGHARFDIDKLSSNFVTIRSFNGNATGSANVTVTDLTKLFIAAIPYNCTVYVFLKQ